MSLNGFEVSLVYSEFRPAKGYIHSETLSQTTWQIDRKHRMHRNQRVQSCGEHCHPPPPSSRVSTNGDSTTCYWRLEQGVLLLFSWCWRAMHCSAARDEIREGTNPVLAGDIADCLENHEDSQTGGSATNWMYLVFNPQDLCENMFSLATNNYKFSFRESISILKWNTWVKSNVMSIYVVVKINQGFLPRLWSFSSQIKDINHLYLQ